LALYWLFSSGVGVKFAKSSSQWDPRPITEEICETLLTNEKQSKKI
jgi:hypothetical protein